MIKGDAVYSILRSALTSFQFFLLSVLVIQFSSLSNWGGFVNAYLVWSFFVMITNSGSKEFLVKSISKTPSNKWYLLSTNTTLRFLLNIPAIVFICLLPSEGIIEKTLMIMIVFLRVLIFTFESIIVYEKKFKISLVVELISFCMLIAIVFIAHYFKAIYPVYILAYVVISDVVKLIGYDILFKFKSNFKVSSFAPVQSFKSTLPFVISGIMGLIMNKADLYIFGIFIKDNELMAEYHILNTLSNLFLIVIGSMVMVRIKVIFRMPLVKFNLVQRVYILYSLAFVLIGLTCFYFLSPFLFHYRVSIVKLLLIALNVLVFSGYILHIYLQSRLDNMRLTNTIIGIAGLVNIICSMMLIPLFKIEGALLAVLLANLVVLIPMNYFSKNYVS